MATTCYLGLCLHRLPREVRERMIDTPSGHTATCSTSASRRCGVEEAAHNQLWWTACKAAGGPGRVPPPTDDLRRWCGQLIDAILAFSHDIARLPGPCTRFWQSQLTLIIENGLSSVTGGLPAHRWLVHARQRTQTRPHPSLDRRLYQHWIQTLVTVVRDLISQAGTAAAHPARTRPDPTATHLLQARHTLQHACRRLNQPKESGRNLL